MKRLSYQDNPFQVIEEGRLFIKTKKGELIRLKMNRAQRRIHELIKKAWQENKIIRLIILKARQLGSCLDPDTFILKADLRWAKIKDIKVGDELVAVDEMHPAGRGHHRRMRTCVVQAMGEVFEDAFLLRMANGQILKATGKHRFLMKQRGGDRTRWRQVADIKIGDEIRYVTQHWGNSNYEDGWAGGMVDGEGSLALKMRTGANINISQVLGPVLDRLEKYMQLKGYHYRKEFDRRKAGNSSKLGKKIVCKIVLSRMNEIFQFVGQVRPVRFIKHKWWEGKELPGKGTLGVGWQKVVSMETLQPQRMIDLQTTTKTYIAEGFVSHNSTYIEALIYAITSFVPNINSLIIADDLDGSNYIFEMSKLYQEKMDACLRTSTKRSNEKKLEFEGTHSQVLIDTAENPEAGRKYTFRLVHLSEYAFFNKNKADAIMLGLSHSVPALPRTMIIKETTANGFNYFKDDWDRAINGESDEVPVFVPWYWGEDNLMPVPAGFTIGDPAHGKVALDELILQKQMEEEGIDQINERLAWRRWDIRNNCKGDIESFRQENPSTPEEAFIASGECFFDKTELARQLKATKPPLFRANILKEDFKYKLRKCDDGVFAFYKEISPYGQYCVGGDAASGSGADYATLVAREKASNEIVAIFRAKVDPDELAYRAMQLGNALQSARVAIENDKFGFAANNKLRTIYGNIYIQRTYNKTDNKIVEKIGWDTNAVTRPTMLAQMQEEVREGSLQLKDKALIRECLTFIKNPDSKKAEAQDGCNDDLVIACAISGMIRTQEPHQPKKIKHRVPGQTITGNAGLKFKKRT